MVLERILIFRDAERMREKQAKKAAEAAAGTSGGGGAKKMRRNLCLSPTIVKTFIYFSWIIRFVFAKTNFLFCVP